MNLKNLAWKVYDHTLAPQVHALFYQDLIRKTDDFISTRWFGQRMMQNPLDAWVLQETLTTLKPELLIECGTHRGGSSLFFANLFDLMNHGNVITIDVQRQHELSHPRITYLIGGSTSDSIVATVRERVEACSGPVMVILDSDHSEAHVRRELDCYTPMVTLGSYCIVQDAVIDTMRMFRGWRPGPLGAIESFLEQTREFQLDREAETRYLVTNQVRGWLKRVLPVPRIPDMVG